MSLGEWRGWELGLPGVAVFGAAAWLTWHGLEALYGGRFLKSLALLVAGFALVGVALNLCFYMTLQ